MVYPLVICDIAIENGPVEIVDLPINSMVICHSYVHLPEGNRYLKDFGSNSISHGIFQWCSLLPTAALFRSEK